MSGGLARALVQEIASDQVALEQLRAMLHPDVAEVPATRPAYTVRSLAVEVGRSERSIRGAIARGELQAVKRGRGYLIPPESVEAWTTPTSPRAPSRARVVRRRGAGPGAMRRGLAGL